MEMEPLLQEELLKRKKHLHQLKRDMPEIWEMIASSRCCPSYIGLSASCTADADCIQCWENAIKIESPVLIKDGQYYCPKCHNKLSLKRMTDNGQEWFCKTCDQTLIVPTAASTTNEK